MSGCTKCPSSFWKQRNVKRRLLHQGFPWKVPWLLVEFSIHSLPQESEDSVSSPFELLAPFHTRSVQPGQSHSMWRPRQDEASAQAQATNNPWNLGVSPFPGKGDSADVITPITWVGPTLQSQGLYKKEAGGDKIQKRMQCDHGG